MSPASEQVKAARQADATTLWDGVEPELREAFERDWAQANESSNGGSWWWDVVSVRRGNAAIAGVYALVQPYNPVIAGGYVRYMVSLAEEPVLPGDLDIYPRTPEAMEAIQQALLDNGWTEAEGGIAAVTYRYTNPTPERDLLYMGAPPVQLIKPTNFGNVIATGTIYEILDNFDLTVAAAGLVDSARAVVDSRLLEDDLNKRIAFRNLKTPIAAVLRVQKYAAKGYRVRPWQVVELFLEWDAATPEYRVACIAFFKALEDEGVTDREIEVGERLLIFGELPPFGAPARPKIEIEIPDYNGDIDTVIAF